MIGFVAVAWGFFENFDWWPMVALISAVISAAMILLWWASLNTSNAFFALVFDLVVIGVLLLQRGVPMPCGH